MLKTMAREFFISSYLFLFNIFFSVFKRSKLKNKTVLIASFGDNINHVRKQALKDTDHNLVILTTRSCKTNFSASSRERILRFEPIHLIQFIKSIYHLATAQVVFVDNYFGFLAVTEFKSDVKVIQLWHAAGAIKKFGLHDPTIKDRSPQAHKRFSAVYQRFTDVVIGSDQMGTIFKQAFGLANDQLLKTGIPRTDFFFDQDRLTEGSKSVREAYPQIKDKKVILYAPTFRDAEIHQATLHLELDRLNQAFQQTHVIILRLHPVVRRGFPIESYADFMIDASDYPKLNDLLTVADYLITDYSSIPFEFSLLNKPMIFYSYDLADYVDERGFWVDYKSNMPGPVVSSTEEVIAHLSADAFDLEKVKQFSDQWNTYSTGESAKLLVESIYKNKRT